MASRTFVRFVLRRITFACALVVVVSSGSFWLAYLAPGDAASDLQRPGVSQQTVNRERTRLGLDRSFAAQYVDWVSRAIRLDFGRSSRYGRPVRDLLGERTQNTAVLAGVSLERCDPARDRPWCRDGGRSAAVDQSGRSRRLALGDLRASAARRSAPGTPRGPGPGGCRSGASVRPRPTTLRGGRGPLTWPGTSSCRARPSRSRWRRHSSACSSSQ